MPLPPRDFRTIGPNEGERFLDVTLPDQTGRLVYEGTIRGLLPLDFTAPPGAGDQVLQVTVRYQACSSSTCLPPEGVHLETPVIERALVGRSLPAKVSTVFSLLTRTSLC